MACAEPTLLPDQLEATNASFEDRQEMRAAVEQMLVLLDAEHPPVVGAVCYYSGVPPKGRQALDELVRMKRTDLMKNLLNAPSPEGRVYAALGLGQMGVMSDAEVKAWVGRIETPVSVCAGCLVLEVSAVEALSYYTFGGPEGFP